LARPSSPLAFRRGFNPTRSALRFSFDSPRRVACDHTTILSWGFAPLQGMPLAARRAASRPRPLPWGSCPLQRHQLWESTCPGLASPGTFRPRGFSPPRRFAPPSALRVCFAPLAPLGFRPPGVFPPKKPPPPRRRAACPLDVRSQIPTVMTRRSRAPPTRAASIASKPSCAFRALSSPGVRTARVIG
jgi:hypothetical protein